MRVTFGDGGWVQVHEIGLPGLLYLRFRAQDRRLRPCEMFIDCAEGSVDQADLRSIPLTRIEAFVNTEPEQLLARIEGPSIEMSVLATHFASGRYDALANYGDPRNRATRTWVKRMFASQRPQEVRGWGEEPEPVVKRQKRNWKPSDQDVAFVLEGGPEAGLTDEFLRDLSRAYAAAVARGERPNLSLAEQTGFPRRTVERWVYLARQRGIMPAGQKGKAG